MIQAENVVKAYEERAQAENWAQWAKDYPEKNRLLAEAERLVNGE